MRPPSHISTGVDGLDAVINSLRLGDNVVWQVDCIAEYRCFVAPFVAHSLAQNARVVYLRFADHEPLVDDPRVAAFNLDASQGFETFTTQVHSIITREGVGTFYVFDCLTDLLSDWASDLMIGNFFMVTCPYLYELDTVTYFALIRDHHSFKTIARIRETTQLLIDVYSWDDHVYIHPLKVWQRYSSTMFLPHQRKGDTFEPLLSSVDATELFSRISDLSAEGARRRLDYWDRLFLEAAGLLETPGDTPEKQRMLDRLCRIAIGREERMLALATKYVSLPDILAIKERMIGTGYIGGKAVGMLLARNILKREAPEWRERLEPHDSFYIGSDVFYTYLVQNGWWKMRMEQKTKEGYHTMAGRLREVMPHGQFPEEIREQFQSVIDYFGQSPIIVRSSSLLEDSFGNAFAGKYESIFLVNQGTPEERYERFEKAVREIYATTMNEDALAYRLQRGLADMDEQMALLVQRVSGENHGGLFFPELAGVGVSYNTFVWRADMDSSAGMVRLVFGLGTRAVNRVEGDYPRVIALDDPLRRPVSDMDDLRRFSQHYVDVLNINDNELQEVSLEEAVAAARDLDYRPLLTRDEELTRRQQERGATREVNLLTFDGLLRTDFCATLQSMMKTLEQAYDYPVDIEFTVNHDHRNEMHINLVQCRPLQARGAVRDVHFPREVDPDRILFASAGNFMGGNVAQTLQRIVVVNPAAYVALSTSGKYDIARLVGRINRLYSRQEMPTMLIGPGRWGTSTPSLGVPVDFAEINNATALVEVASQSDGLMPELSFGTHFFQDLVEMEIFFVALFPERPTTTFQPDRLAQRPNALTKHFPNEQRYADVVQIYEADAPLARVYADIVQQQTVCVLE